jgi:hypothetical protein
LVCVSLNCAGFFSACGPFICMGMRPVPTWKSTAAAPTPTSEGPDWEPLAPTPWQVAQLAANSLPPSATSLAL